MFEGPGRENINYRERVVDINKIKEWIGVETPDEENMAAIIVKISDLNTGAHSKYTNLCSQYLGTDFKERLSLSEDMQTIEVYNKIAEYIEERLDESEKKKLQKDNFLNRLSDAIMR